MGFFDDPNGGMQGLLGNPLFNIGLGLLAANRPGTSFGQALGQGGLLGLQNMQQFQQQQALNGYRQAQLAETQRKAEAERQQQERLTRATASLPPGMRDVAMAAPDKFFGAQADSFFPKPDAKTDIAKLIAERDRFPVGDPNRQFYDAAIAKATERAPKNPVAIPDEKSPTGFRYVDPSAALGQPALGPSGLSMEFGPDGRPTAIFSGPGSQKKEPKPLTEVEGKATNFANRMQAAEARLNSIVSQGYQPGGLTDNLANRAGVPGNYAMSEQGQQYYQAQKDWVRAKLRLESGAVIGDEEEKNEIRTFFPQPGDSDAVIEQKRQARATAFEGTKVQAGKGTERLQPPPAADPPRKAAPPVGTVERGYRFKGGDPSKPESWEQVR